MFDLGLDPVEWAAAYVRRGQRRGVPAHEVRAIVEAFSDLFMQFNLRFDVHRFLATCRGQDAGLPVRLRALPEKDGDR